MFPCKHIVCPGCMVNNMLLKESDEDVSCPCCFNQTTHHVYRADEIPHDNRIKEGNLEGDPFQYFENLPLEKQKGKMLITFIYYPSKKNCVSEPQKYTCMLDEKKGAITEKDEDELVSILSLLRCAILCSPVEEQKKRPKINCMNDFHWKQDVFADNRPVTKYFYAICMGGIDLEGDKRTAKNDAEIKSKIFANRVVVELAMRLVNKYCSMPFQRMIGQYLSTIPHASKLHKLLTGLRLSVHIQKVRHDITTQEIQVIRKGKRLHAKGFTSSCVDNCEYSGPAKTESFTHFMYADNSEEDLILDGSFEWDQNDGKEWDQLIEEEGEENLNNRVFNPTEGDWLCLSNYVITFIDTMKNATELPDYNTCLEMVQEGEYSNAGCIPKNLGVHLQEPSTPYRMRQNDIDKGRDHKKMSFYERNRLSIQPPFHGNLSKLETVLELTDTVMRDIDRWKDPKEQTLQGLVYAICADGAPVSTFLKEKERREEQGDEKYAKAMWFSMPFHLMINSLRNLNGKHSREAFIAVNKQWRKSSQRLDWALNCPDPKDIFNELYQYVVGMTRNLCDQVGDQDNRSIYSHQLARAKQYPICFMFLIHLKFSTIILMLQDSWRSGDHGDVSQYLTCLRYLIRLESISNAPKYLHMNTHFLKWYECSSTCLKKIFEFYLLTKVTNNGELMPTDLCMEKHIGDVRYTYGKKCFTNMAARLATEVPQLNKTMSRYDGEFQKRVNDEEPDSYNKRLYKLGEPYIVKSYNNFAQSLNLWGHGPLNIDNYEDLLSPVSGEIISNSILESCWTESEKRE